MLLGKPLWGTTLTTCPNRRLDATDCVIFGRCAVRPCLQASSVGPIPIRPCLGIEYSQSCPSRFRMVSKHLAYSTQCSASAGSNAGCGVGDSRFGHLFLETTTWPSGKSSLKTIHSSSVAGADPRQRPTKPGSARWNMLMPNKRLSRRETHNKSPDKDAPTGLLPQIWPCFCIIIMIPWCCCGASCWSSPMFDSWNSLNGFIFFLYVLSKYFVLFDGRYRFTSYWVQGVRPNIQLLCLEDMEKNKRFPDHYTQKVDMSKAQNLRKHIVRVHHTHTHPKISETKLIDLIGNRFLMVDQPGTEKRCDVNICKQVDSK